MSSNRAFSSDRPGAGNARPDAEDARRQAPPGKSREDRVPLTALCLLLCGVYFFAITLADAYGDRFSRDSRIEAAVQAVAAFGETYPPLAVFLGLALPQEPASETRLPTLADYLKLRDGAGSAELTAEEALARYLEKYGSAAASGEESAEAAEDSDSAGGKP